MATANDNSIHTPCTFKEAVAGAGQVLDKSALALAAPQILKAAKAQRRADQLAGVTPKTEPYVNRTYAVALAKRLQVL